MEKAAVIKWDEESHIKATPVCVTQKNDKRATVYSLGSQAFFVILESMTIGIERLRREFASAALSEIDQLAWCCERAKDWVDSSIVVASGLRPLPE